MEQKRVSVPRDVIHEANIVSKQSSHHSSALQGARQMSQN